MKLVCNILSNQVGRCQYVLSNRFATERSPGLGKVPGQGVVDLRQRHISTSQPTYPSKCSQFVLSGVDKAVDSLLNKSFRLVAFFGDNVSFLVHDAPNLLQMLLKLHLVVFSNTSDCMATQIRVTLGAQLLCTALLALEALATAIFISNFIKEERSHCFSRKKISRLKSSTHFLSAKNGTKASTGNNTQNALSLLTIRKPSESSALVPPQTVIVGLYMDKRSSLVFSN